MVLTNPEMASGIVGIQPLVSMDTAEAGLFYQSFRRAGIDFNQDFSFLEFGEERDHLKILVNDRAAENVLKTHQGILGITLPDRPLKKDEIISFSTQLLGQTDTRKANLAHGLLIGFPLEDCQHWVELGQPPPAIPALKQVENVDTRFGDQTITTKDGKQITGRWNPIPNLNPGNYSMAGSRNHYLPDTRTLSKLEYL